MRLAPTTNLKERSLPIGDELVESPLVSKSRITQIVPLGRSLDDASVVGRPRLRGPYSSQYTPDNDAGAHRNSIPKRFERSEAVQRFERFEPNVVGCRAALVLLLGAYFDATKVSSKPPEGALHALQQPLTRQRKNRISVEKTEIGEIDAPPVYKELKSAGSTSSGKFIETDPPICPKRQAEMRIISFIDQPGVKKNSSTHGSMRRVPRPS